VLGDTMLVGFGDGGVKVKRSVCTSLKSQSKLKVLNNNKAHVHSLFSNQMWSIKEGKIVL